MKDFRQIPFGKPWITDEDRAAVLEVLGGNILTHGPQGKAFEAEFGSFLGDGAHCVTVSSCMAALHLAYLQFGIGPGDEVIVPAQTHTATAHAVEWVGATPVFADCDPLTGNLKAENVAQAMTSRTKAISVVHFAGIPCDVDGILALANRQGLKVVEDCAIALGARYREKHVGLLGDAGCFSFYPVKHITTGEGGMLVSRHRDIAEGVEKLRAFGVDRSHTERSLPGMYDVPLLGLNYRMSEMQAALGRTQLRRIDENLRRRRSNFEMLKQSLERLPGIHILDATHPSAENSYYCLIVVLENGLAAQRNDIMLSLNRTGIGTSIYYPHPVPRMRYYRDKYGYDASCFPHAAHISDHSFALPVGPHVTEDDVQYMAQTLKGLLKEVVV